MRRTPDGYEVATEQGSWHCKAVVLATGGFNIAQLPKLSEAVPARVAQLTPVQYRHPESLAPGGVLVVGAAATGAQLADEIQRSGRPVTLAVGEHVRATRTYRGKDLQWWMDATGLNGPYYYLLPEGLPPGRSSTLGRSLNASTIAPALSTSLNEWLGLKLEPRTGTVQVLVVDSIQRPTGN